MGKDDQYPQEGQYITSSMYCLQDHPKLINQSLPITFTHPSLLIFFFVVVVLEGKGGDVSLPSLSFSSPLFPLLYSPPLFSPLSNGIIFKIKEHILQQTSVSNMSVSHEMFK